MKYPYFSYLIGLIAIVSVSSLDAASPVSVQIDGNTASADIQLVGGLQVDVTLAFDDAVGLSSSNLNMTAELISPQDLSLLARMPTSMASIPAAFPVLLTIEPPAQGGLSFSGTYSIELHTHNLSYVTNSPFRLFCADLGEDFVDITEYVGPGSIRSRGRRSGFSQFIIVVDPRDHDNVAAQKFADLASLTAASAAATQLNPLVANAESAFVSGNYVAALSDLDQFKSQVALLAGDTLPDVWRSSRDIDNVAGQLQAAASTLQFSLSAANNLVSIGQ